MSEKSEALAQLREYAEKYRIRVIFTRVVRTYHEQGIPYHVIKVFAIDARGLAPDYAGTPVIWLTGLLAKACGFEGNGADGVHVYSEYDAVAAFDRAVHGAGKARSLHMIV